MASRLGILPWDRENLSPAEIKDLWEGWQWRRSRDMEVLAQALMWLISLQTAEGDYDKVLMSLPGYDQQRVKDLQEAAGSDLEPPWLI